MRSHGRIVRVAIATLVAGPLFASAMSSSAGALSTPTLTAALTRGTGVKISWSFDSTLNRDGLVLQIERSVNGSVFQLWKSVNRPRAKSSAKDTLVGRMSYRGRLLQNGETGGWSPVTSIGSSPKFSPPRPPCGTRAMSMAGARIAFLPAVRTSRPRAAP